MTSIKDMIQSADWKKEKHVPVIELQAPARKMQSIQADISVGKGIAHPNTTEHHIAWIEVYFLAQGEKFPYLLARFDFAAHGASTLGPNTSTIASEPKTTVVFKTDKPGTLHALSYCNMHGIWEDALEITLA